ncbi:helicase [Rhizobium sp. LjRoot98]|uniref:DEAD/DEAH box helicase n=1 Tax=Rhizobium sp. LjRoot98 TaxID=3342345 RepID=UPI003ECC97AD
MEIDELREALKAGISSDNAAPIFAAVAALVNSAALHDVGREMVIRCLAVKTSIPPGYFPLLEALIRAVGLLPYLDLTSTNTFENQLLLEAHRVPTSGKVGVFHTLQLQIYRELIAGRNVVLSATTSVGKSAIVDAVISSGRHKHLAIIVPTIALIDETRRRIAGTFGERFEVVTHPSQISSSDVNTVFVLTQERALSRDDLMNVTFFVIDEFYKLDLRGEDDDRAVDLNLCFHKLAATGAQFYLIGPHVDAVVGLASKHEYLFIPSLFSTVALDIIQFNLPQVRSIREGKLIELCGELTTPTLIYCQSPGAAQGAAEALLNSSLFKETPETASAVEWLEYEYPNEWIVTRALQQGIGIHHGNLPRALQQYMVKAFELGFIKFLICTSTMIEGVNTIAENVIIFDKRIGRNKGIDHFTFRNIAGRAGRMRQYFVGKVFVLEEQPSAETYSVEVAVATQSESTPLSLLLDLDDADLSPPALQRVNDARSNSPLSHETLKANRHVPLDTQHAIYRAIRNDLHHYEDVLSWTGMPAPHQLLGVCDLIYDYFDENTLKGYGIFSGLGLKASINRVQMSERFRDVIDNFVRYRREDVTISGGVELALRFMRKYLGYTFPRHLMAISTIQADLFLKVDRKPGDYSLFAARTESLFIEPGLFALDEYGVAPETARKLAKGSAAFPTLESALRLISSPDLNVGGLFDFEVELIRDVAATLPIFKQSVF